MAALPWGNAEAAVGTKRGARDEGAGDERERDTKRRDTGGGGGAGRAEARPMEELGLHVGSKLEVKWDLVDDETQEKRSLWWGCKVARASGTEGTWVLVYEAMEGFESESREVRFLGEHRLEDVADAQEMHWRHEGDLDYEVAEEEEVVTLSEVLEEVQEEEQAAAEDGVSLQDLEREEMGKLPMERQQQVANGFRHLADHLKNQIKQLAERNEGEYTVTQEDIKKMFSSLPRG